MATEPSNSRGCHSSALSPPPPPCCFRDRGFARLLALALLEGSVGSTLPLEGWITPSMRVSCQVASCTCCLRQGGPKKPAWPELGHIITASEIITLFTYAHTHNR